MPDPLSIAAGITAIATLAAQSCSHLYSFLKAFTETSDELEHHLLTIQALRSTFASISRLEQENANDLLTSSAFRARLQKCTQDLLAFEKLVEPFQQRLNEGTLRRNWAKLKWSSIEQRQNVKKYLARFDSYQTTLTMDLLLLDIHLGHQSRSNPLSSRCLTNGFIPSSQTLASPEARESNESGLEAHSRLMRPPIARLSSVSSRFSTSFDNTLWPLSIWLGPVKVQEAIMAQNEFQIPLESERGFGVGFAMTYLSYMTSFRLELAVYLARKDILGSMNFSLNWSLSLPRVLPWEASVVHYIETGDVSSIQHALSSDFFSPFDVLPDGSTLLHVACTFNGYNVVKLLLGLNAKVNALNDFGESPLHVAVEVGNDYNIARLLLDHGADLSNRTIDGKTPLHTFYTPTVEQILQCHCSDFEFSTKDKSGRNLLHYLSWSSTTPVHTFENYHTRFGFDINAVDKAGIGLLHLAAGRGNVDVVNYLLHTVRADSAQAPDCKGRPPLHYGIASKRAPQIIEALVSHGANLRSRDESGRSVLHFAAKARNLAAVKTLLAMGAGPDLDDVDTFGLTPLQLAQCFKAGDVVDFLRRRIGPDARIGLATSTESVAQPISLAEPVSNSLEPLSLPPFPTKDWQRFIDSLRCGLWDAKIPIGFAHAYMILLCVAFWLAVHKD